MHFSFSGDRGNYPQSRVSAIKRSPSQESIIPQRRHTTQQFAAQQFAAQQFAAQQFAGQQLAGRQLSAQRRAGQQLAAQQLAEQQRAGQQLAAQQLAEQQRAGQHRVAQQLAAQQLAAQQLAAQQLAAQQLAEQQRVAQQRAAQQLAAQQREAQQLAAQQLAAQQLAAQQLAAQQLAAQQLAEQQLAAQQLAAQQQQQKNERLIEQQRKVEEENKMVESYNKHYDTFVPSSQKSYHRFKCFSNLDLIRNIIIDDFGDSSKKKETILIEFRPFVHLEYLLRNTILKLSNWDHTVVCGNKNYDMISKMCNKICDGSTSSIKIIRLDIDNLVPSEYSKLLLTKDFWDKFDGEKLLVYQEDSMLFHSDIEPFLKYDYVGAPWPENQDDNALGVGNGGFSLRTKSKLLECIEKVKPEDLQLGSSTSDYMKNTKSYIVPEDVYFSKSMIDRKIGKVAPRDVAIEFSQETQLSKNPLGGHNYWLANPTTMSKLDLNTYYNTGRYFRGADHRSGWKGAVTNLYTENIIQNNTRNVVLVDSMEEVFLWNKREIKTDWVGIFHYSYDSPEQLSHGQHLKQLLMKSKKSLKTCKGLVALSTKTQQYAKEFIKSLGYENIPVYFIKHPIEKMQSKFSLYKFMNNKEYKIVQLGQQYRKVSTIYTINSDFPKLWLSGFDENKSLNILNTEKRYLNIDIRNDVHIMRTKTDKDYDNILLNNIMIIPLWDAAANNSVLECLEMYIPAFVTRLPATEEYLGKEYPMFYTDISEVEKVINNRKLLHQKYEETHKYLLKVDKRDIRYKHFNSELLKIINL